MARPDGRHAAELRSVTITPDYTRWAEGSVLVEFGETKVLCTASVEERVPPFLEGTGKGWVTAEYSMLPRSTHTRSRRDPGGRGQEIQRLIGRALRMAVDGKGLGPRQITVDCDVIQADGGTRTAAITGGWTALAIATRRLHKAGKVIKDPVHMAISAISSGIVNGEARVDLAYTEDSNADVDFNFVMTDAGQFVEIQGTGERTPFRPEDFARLAALSAEAMKTLFAKQREALEKARA